MATQGNGGGDKVLTLALRWAAADGLETRYANQVLITHAGSEFYLVFGEAAPPAIVGDQPPPDYVEIEPVARLALTPDAMLAVASVIATNVSKYLETKAESEGASDD